MTCRGCCCLLAVLAVAPPPGAGPDSMEAALAEPADLGFAQTPLPDAAALIAASHRIPLFIDERSLKAEGIIPARVELTAAKGRPLGAVLDEALRPHTLVWIVRHETLFITTENASKKKYLDTRVYKMTRRVPAQRRINSITALIEPKTWANLGGPGDAVALPPRLMVVRQSPWVHRQIAAKYARSLVPVRSRRDGPAANGKMQRKLAGLARFEFADARAGDVFEFLSKTHGLNITVDKASLKKAGISTDAAVTMRLGARVTLASGLSLLLQRIDDGLTWVAGEEGVTITTVAAAKRLSTRRTYQVKGLLPEGGFDLLSEAIQLTIAPDDWEDVGGEGVIQPGGKDGALDVKQNPLVHRQLRRLFADLTAAGASG